MIGEAKIEEKKKTVKNFPYKPIKGHMTWADAQSETGWLSVEQIFWRTVMGRQTTTVRHLV